MTFHLFFSFLCTPIFFACQGELDEFHRAQELQQKGAKVEALKIYEDIIVRYPNHPDAQKSKRELEILYNEAAKASTNPYHALLITQKQLEIFPEGGFVQEAQSRLPTLKKEAEKYLEQQRIENDLCAQAKKRMSVSVWKEYAQAYPQGECHRDAEQSLLDLEKKLCTNARKGDHLLWKQYLQDFPNGPCAEEAKAMSVQKEPSENDLAPIYVHVKECKRLAEKCPKLVERFSTLIEKNEFSYLQGSYYAYLNNWLEAYNVAAQEAQNGVQELEKNGFRIDSIAQEVQLNCIESCAPNVKILSDVGLCKRASAANGEEAAVLWKEYEQTFPKGGCLALIPR